jgi:hypothetical protein
MKSIILIQFKSRIPSKKTKFNKDKKKQKPRQPMLFSKRLKNIIESKLKNNKMLEDEKKKAQKVRKKPKETYVNFVNWG